MSDMCSRCGAQGVRLWRESNTFADKQTFYCVGCALQRSPEYGYDPKHPACIGGLVALRRDLDGSIWGHTSGPQDGVEAWLALPLAAPQATALAEKDKALVEMRAALERCEDHMTGTGGHGCVCRCPVIDGHGPNCPLVAALASDAGKGWLSPAEVERVLAAVRGLLEIGKRDLTNAKYDGYFTDMREALALLEVAGP